MLVIVIASYVVFFIGIFASRIVSLEMMATMQISYLGLFILNMSDPLVESLYSLKYTNGGNILLNFIQEKTPNRIHVLGLAG